MKKINLKNKIMLAILAGGMLCMNGALASDYPAWYGDQDSATTWRGKTDGSDISSYVNYRTTGANLTLDGVGTTSLGDAISFADVEMFYGGFSKGSDNVTQNIITVTGGDFTDKSIYGGHSESGEASYNEVNVNNGYSSSVFQVTGADS